MKLSGRKVLLIFASIITVLLSTKSAIAKTIITGDQESSVTIKNQYQSQNNSQNTTTGKTDIVIECNGVKKEYHSDKAENVTLNCDDSTSGTVKNEIKITSDTSPTTKVTANPKQIEELKKKTDEIKKEVREAKEKVKEERKDLFEQMTQMFREFFKNFHF